MEKKEKETVCSGCMGCFPYDYTIEVDLGFLQMMRKALLNLQKYEPNHFAIGWLDDCNRYIKEVEKKYQKIN